MPRFGHITSNIVETVNTAWKKLGIRDKPVPVLLDAVWEHVAKQMYERSKMDMKGNRLTPRMAVIAELRHQAGRSYTVESYADGVATVKKDATVRVVDIDNVSCSCDDFVETGYPYCHAMAVCAAQQLDGTNWFPLAYTAEKQRQQYQQQFMPVLLSDCLFIEPCETPKPKPQGERPPKAAHPYGLRGPHTETQYAPDAKRQATIRETSAAGV